MVDIQVSDPKTCREGKVRSIGGVLSPYQENELGEFVYFFPSHLHFLIFLLYTIKKILQKFQTRKGTIFKAILSVGRGDCVLDPGPHSAYPAALRDGRAGSAPAAPPGACDGPVAASGFSAEPQRAGWREAGRPAAALETEAKRGSTLLP